jgi:hypothetical protein
LSDSVNVFALKEMVKVAKQTFQVAGLSPWSSVCVQGEYIHTSWWYCLENNTNVPFLSYHPLKRTYALWSFCCSTFWFHLNPPCAVINKIWQGISLSERVSYVKNHKRVWVRSHRLRPSRLNQRQKPRRYVKNRSVAVGVHIQRTHTHFILNLPLYSICRPLWWIDGYFSSKDVVDVDSYAAKACVWCRNWSDE